MPETVTLSEPGVAGSYVVAERRADGTLVLRPGSSDEVVDQFAGRALSDVELEQSFDRLDDALEREGRAFQVGRGR